MTPPPSSSPPPLFPFPLPQEINTTNPTPTPNLRHLSCDTTFHTLSHINPSRLHLYIYPLSAPKLSTPLHHPHIFPLQLPTLKFPLLFSSHPPEQTQSVPPSVNTPPSPEFLVYPKSLESPSLLRFHPHPRISLPKYPHPYPFEFEFTLLKISIY